MRLEVKEPVQIPGSPPPTALLASVANMGVGFVYSLHAPRPGQPVESVAARHASREPIGVHRAAPPPKRERGGSGAGAVWLRADGVGRAGLCGRRCLARGARLGSSCTAGFRCARERPEDRGCAAVSSLPPALALPKDRRLPGVGRGL